jgi:hypothetical protein
MDSIENMSVSQQQALDFLKNIVRSNFFQPYSFKKGSIDAAGFKIERIGGINHEKSEKLDYRKVADIADMVVSLLNAAEKTRLYTARMTLIMPEDVFKGLKFANLIYDYEAFPEITLGFNAQDRKHYFYAYMTEFGERLLGSEDACAAENKKLIPWYARVDAELKHALPFILQPTH